MLIIDASPRLWTPADLPIGTLSLWLDAADFTIVTVVSEWRDKSEFNRHATATTRRPNVTIVNGLYVVNFTASGATRLDTPAFNIAPDRQFCTFAVVSGAGLLGGSTYRRIFVAKGGVNPDALATGSTYPQGYFGSGPNAGTAMQIAGGNGVTAPQITGLGTGPQLLTGAFGTAGLAANENSISANGGTRSTLTGQSGALSTTGIRLGSDVSTAAVSSWNDWIAEFIMTLALSSWQVRLVEGYLAWKRWNMYANLPIDHPFKNRPPLVSDI
jgi:hypothetical protein